jgi:hypothetical protein
MARTVQLIRVFVASPSDVEEQRQSVREAIVEVNRSLASSEVRLEFVGWETHVDPNIGDYPQDVVNRQIGDDYDLFLGIMWTRFGTPTKSAESGTEEEFRRAVARHATDPNSVSVKFYFKDMPIEPSRLDPEQLTKVLDFKRSLGDDFGAYVASFRDASDFDSKIRVDLLRFSQNTLATSSSSAGVTDVAASSSDEIARIGSEVLRSLHAIDAANDTTEGFLEALDRGNRAAVAMTRAVSDIGATMASLFEAVGRAGKQMAVSKLPGVTLDADTARIILDGITVRFDSFVAEVSDPVVRFHSASVDMKASFDETVTILEESWEFIHDREPIVEVAGTLEFLVSSIGEARGQLSTLRGIIGQFPRLSVGFNRATRRAGAVIDDFGSVLDATVESTGALAQRIRALGVR